MTRFIFGTGICLLNNWKLIKKHFKPDFCTDNNSNKWNQMIPIVNLQCVSPKELVNYESPEVLITIGDPYIIEEIILQLQKQKIPYRILLDELEKWGEEEPFPQHLQALKIQAEKRRIILFNTPEHDNIGDHLISISTLSFLKKYVSEYEIYEVTDIEYLWHRMTLRRYLKKDDIIVITGGGFLGSLWLYNGELNVRNIIHDYMDNKVIIFPQTIYFENNNRGKKEYMESLSSYNSHPDLTICVREVNSYQLLEKAKNRKYKLELVPDMALLYETQTQYQREPQKVMMCLRNDKECILSKEEANKILEVLLQNGWNVKDISMHSGACVGIEKREQEVKKKLEEIASAQLVITDTLHCMISAAITGTPCIAFDNLSSKVKYVYEWIDYLSYMHFCNDTTRFDEYVNKVIKSNIGYYLKDKGKYTATLEKVIRG